MGGYVVNICCPVTHASEYVTDDRADCSRWARYGLPRSLRQSVLTDSQSVELSADWYKLPTLIDRTCLFKCLIPMRLSSSRTAAASALICKCCPPLCSIHTAECSGSSTHRIDGSTSRSPSVSLHVTGNFERLIIAEPQRGSIRSRPRTVPRRSLMGPRITCQSAAFMEKNGSWPET